MERKYRVLLVEDDPIVSNMYASGLEALGWEVQKTRDGREAIRMLGSDPPDVAVIDLRLVGVDGPIVIKAARIDPQAARVPIVVLTNYSKDDPPVREAIKLGVRLILEKISTSPRQLSEALAASVSD